MKRLMSMVFMFTGLLVFEFVYALAYTARPHPHGAGQGILIGFTVFTTICVLGASVAAVIAHHFTPPRN